MVPGDLLQVAHTHAESWRASYRGILSDQYLDTQSHADRARAWEGRRAALIAGELVGHVVAVHGEGSTPRVLGFSAIIPSDELALGHCLDNLHVAAEAQGKGMGRHLLAAAVREMLSRNTSQRRLYLWVYTANESAQRFYERCGGVRGESQLLPTAEGGQAPAYRYVWDDMTVLLIEPP
jgi:GNAT superfamily N-acetyltransferase